MKEEPTILDLDLGTRAAAHGGRGATRPTCTAPNGGRGATRPTGTAPDGGRGATRPTCTAPDGGRGATRPTIHLGLMKEEPTTLDLDLKSRPSLDLDLKSRPVLTAGGRHEDARGALRFCNDFDMSPVKRFYTVSNSAEQPKRGWIMHKRETKWFFPMCGVTRIVVQADGSSSALELPQAVEQTFTLSASNPAVLRVPPGNWFLIEQHDGAEVQVFSNCHVGEFQDDDFRKEIEP